VGGAIIILEEAAYISLETFLEVVAPILILEHSCLIAISTMGKEPSNFFTKLLNCNLFYVHRITYVCESCIAKGIQRQCKHRLDSIPHWSNEGKLETVKNLFGDDQGDRFERENLGVVAEEAGPQCFSASKIRKFMTEPRRSLDRPQRYVYCCVDPCAGSDIEDKRTSDFAIITISGPNHTILGMEAIDAVQHEDYDDRLVEHLRRIRALRYCEDAIIVLDVESGTGFEAGHITKLVQENFNNVVVMKDFHRKPGTSTTNAAKKEMMELTRSLLNTEDLFINKDFVCTDKDPAKILGKFQDQMLEYSRIVTVGRSIRNMNHEVFSGKGPNKTKLDDLGVTFQRALRCRKEFLYSGKYDLHHR
jgi:hypothetical protein